MSRKETFRNQLRWLIPAALVVLGGIQLIPVDRSNPAVKTEIQAPDSVAAILHRACYDCHSNETRWPWYSHVAPMSWLVTHHVEEGRGNLNFSEWPLYDFEEQDHSMKDIRKQISKKKMPLKSYLLLHPDAQLSEADRAVLLRWAKR